MKKIIIVLLCLAVSGFLTAQEAQKQKEIGLVFGNLDNFGLTYKTGTSTSLWRFQSLIISGNKQEESADSILHEQKSFGFGLKIGREYRKDITENLEFRYGADLGFTYSKRLQKSDDNWLAYSRDKIEEEKYIPGIEFIIGFNYKLSGAFIIGAELSPGFNYVTGKSTRMYYYNQINEEIESDISGWTFGLSNTPVLLSLVYRL